jgi:hypothetical protein
VPSALRTVVTFESSAFNTSETKPYFINACCFGDDVAKWLAAELRAAGYSAETDPGQEDFGWYFNFEVGGLKHCFVVGYRPGVEKDTGEWIGWIERRKFGLLFRGRGISPAAAEALHKALARSEKVRSVRWHYKRDFDKGWEDRGMASPSV